MKLATYLKNKFPNLSSREIKRALEQGACTVNACIERFGSRQIDPAKDLIKFKAIKTQATKKLTIQKERIIFENQYILVYDKEAGHPSLPTESNKVNLHQMLKTYLNYDFLEPVHRLDKHTSGLIIFAKSKIAVEKFTQLFAEHKIQKEYIAIVDGVWKHATQGQIETRMRLEFKKGSMQKWQVSKSKKDKIAITDYKILKQYKNYTSLILKPRTGRTHQLRVHMAYLGHPILGDSLYAKNFKSKIFVSRQLLHAHKIIFQDPFSLAQISLIAELPKDMKDFLD